MIAEFLAFAILSAANYVWIFGTVAVCAIVKWKVGVFPAIVTGVISFGTLFVSMYWVFGYTNIVYCGSERFYPDDDRRCFPGGGSYASMLASKHEYGQGAFGWAVVIFAVALALLFVYWVRFRRGGRYHRR